MKSIIALILVAVLTFVVVPTGEGRGHTYKYPRHTVRPVYMRHSRARTSAPVSSREQRSAAAKRTFLRSVGLTQTPRGYVIDHAIPLCAGGLDAPSNMQLQTVEAAKVKDRWEKTYCRPHYLGAHH